MAVFVVGACAAVPLVTYLILYEIDPATSFYYDNANLVPFVNGLLIVLTVLLVIPGFIKKAGAPQTIGTPGAILKKQPALAVFSLLFAVLLLASSAWVLYRSLFPKVDIGAFLTGVTGILGSIFFFVFGADCFRAKRSDLRLTGLLPVLWGVVNLIVTFMSLTQVANISQYLYCVLQMVFAILFLYYNARLLGGVSNGRELNGVFAFGLPCAFFGLLSSLPPVLAHLFNSKRGSLPTLQDGAFFTMSLYILALLVSLLVKKPAKPAAEIIEQTAEPAAEQPAQPQAEPSLPEDKPESGV
jgi:hypothetical protein